MTDKNQATPICPKCEQPMGEFRHQEGEEFPGSEGRVYCVPAILRSGYSFTWVCMECKTKGETGYASSPKPLTLDDFEQIGIDQGDERGDRTNIVITSPPTYSANVNAAQVQEQIEKSLTNVARQISQQGL